MTDIIEAHICWVRVCEHCQDKSKEAFPYNVLDRDRKEWGILCNECFDGLGCVYPEYPDVKSEDVIDFLQRKGEYSMALFVIELNMSYQEVERQAQILQDEMRKVIKSTNEELRDKVKLADELQVLREEIKVLKQRNS